VLGISSTASAGPRRADNTVYVFAALLVAVTASIIALSAFGMETLSEVRAYVAAEGRWSKGQKDAVYQLRLYAGSHDERDYRQFRENLAVPLGDNRARLELEKPGFDWTVASEGLIAGGNDPRDVPGMIRLYRRFGRTDPLARTIRFWEAGDLEISSLAAVGDRLHQSILSGPPGALEIEATLREIDGINARATRMEIDFSRSLAEGARGITNVLLRLIVGVGLLLVALAVWLLRRLRRGEAAARHSDLVYKSLVEQAPFGIFRSTAEGGIVAVNPAIVEMLGYGSARELLEKDLSRDVYVDGSARNRSIDVLLQQGHTSSETDWRRQDGRNIAVRLSSRVILDAHGKPLHFSTIVEDITERRNLESQLRQSQKMEAIGQLASGVAHDFNNLLAVIMGSAEMLLEELPAESRSREDIVEILGASKSAAQLTRQLLAFSRKQALAPRLVNLNELIGSTEKLLRRTLGGDMDLRTMLATDLGVARADPGQLEQVIINLAVNARDAMASGGRLTIETANVELDASYVDRHMMVPPGRYVVMTVSDTGTGMDAAVQARIFEPFFTTKPRDKGTGLGLATVYGIVKQSGGFIWVYSELGRGTVFKVYLPRVFGDAESTAAPAAESQLLDGTETILVAEDQEEVRKYTRKLLEARGYAVLAAAGGAEALQIAARYEGIIHGLVTDVIMPGMSGRELALTLLKTRPRTKVLYVSGYADESLVPRGVLDQGVALLQKPFTAVALARKLREVLADDLLRTSAAV
jgi:PAS domain S-box-containing protein